MLEWLRAAHRLAKGWDTSIVVAVLIWIVLRSYLIEAFRIPSASMENTLLVGDFLFVNKAIYGGELEIPGTGIRLLHAPGYADPQRDGIVVFRSVEDSTPNLNIVKRVIGAAGDTLQMVHDTAVADQVLHRTRHRPLPSHDPRLGPGGRRAATLLRDGRQSRRVLRQPVLGIPAPLAHRGPAADHLLERRDRPAADPLEPHVPATTVMGSHLLTSVRTAEGS
jgi:signal peptidase I